MDSNTSQSFDDTEDTDTLRLQLHDATTQLQAAAHMGLELVEQNQEMRQRLANMEEMHEDLKQRLGLVERDRRWMQDHFLRVDQLRASVNELVHQADSARTRRAVNDQRLGSLDYAVDKLREDLDSLVQTVDRNTLPRRLVSEMATAHRSLNDMKDNAASQDARINELYERTGCLETRQRSQHAEVMRYNTEVDGRILQMEGLQDEAQGQSRLLESELKELEHSLRTIVSEYCSMLHDHEQTIRVLGDAQASLESQHLALADKHDLVCSGHPMPHYNSSYTYSATTGGGFANALQTPETAGRIGHSGDRRVRRNGKAILKSESDEDIVSLALAQTPDGLLAQKRTSTKRVKVKRDSAIGEGKEDIGECLGDIFANDAVTENSSVLFPSPPMSMAGEIGSDSSTTQPLQFITSLSTTPRKAASVIGTNCGRSPTRARMRPRVSSFSRLENSVVSPFKLPSPGFGRMISTQSHVGLGWGNYWEARRHRLQFNIQTRLGLSPAIVSAKMEDACNITSSPSKEQDLAAAD
ncbi:hypothetical protein COEREDRAFT_81844 [Coemansia reversa NRRL 1564]|uniref:Uncharacterized protein n=1 Tax=Coemansia reversa (strain ATCC 12441 / NRRL 1564) TaxID=763665 RepID=A0A2G5B9N5_COERN|nr:hypothetical protein COEREDRAFT_81844 [Coemansia reversa NRRL 1564]|eukprot:PIA15725.1 hypothetical protein COEREDRAFT_81844 [Coemansia reversa NRRL 1564]